MTEERAVVTSRTTLHNMGPDLATLELDSNSLEIKSVEMCVQ